MHSPTRPDDDDDVGEREGVRDWNRRRMPPPSLRESMHNSLVCTTTLVEAERVKRVYVTKKTRKKRSLYLIYHLCTLHFFCRSPAGARVKASRSRGSLTVFISAEA